MRFDRLDLNLLVAFDLLAERRSVSRVAIELGLTQPAVSAALSRLRDFFGDELLVPSGREMLLTARADELRDPVREALILIRSKITTPTAFDPETAQRRIVLCGSDYAFDILLNHVIRRAARVAPGLTFDFVPIDLRAAERLERNEIDLYLTISAYVIPSHPRETLWQDEMCVISWADGKYGRVLDKDGFMAAGHVIAYFGADRQPSIAERHYEGMGIKRKIEVKLPNFSQLPIAVLGTDRIATIHRRHANFYAERLPLSVHNVPFETPKVIGEVQWHRLRATDMCTSFVRGLIKDCAVDLSNRSVIKHAKLV